MNRHDMENEDLTSFADIAREIGCSPQTALNDANRAMEKIRSTRSDLRDYLIELTEEKQ